MRKFIFITVFITIFLAASSAQELPVVNVINDIGFTMNSLHFRPLGSDTWGANILTNDLLFKESVRTRLPSPLNEINVYDILAVDRDGDSYYKRNVTITPDMRITFTIRDLVWN